MEKHEGVIVVGTQAREAEFMDHSAPHPGHSKPYVQCRAATLMYGDRSRYSKASHRREEQRNAGCLQRHKTGKQGRYPRGIKAVV